MCSTFQFSIPKNCSNLSVEDTWWHRDRGKSWIAIWCWMVYKLQIWFVKNQSLFTCSKVGRHRWYNGYKSDCMWLNLLLRLIQLCHQLNPSFHFTTIQYGHQSQTQTLWKPKVKQIISHIYVGIWSFHFTVMYSKMDGVTWWIVIVIWWTRYWTRYLDFFFFLICDLIWIYMR